MTLVDIKPYFEIAAYIAGVVSVPALAWQTRKERITEEYRTLQALEEKYTTLLWKASDDSAVDGVWKAVPSERKRVFDSLLGQAHAEYWPIWEAMSASERNCYRFTRAGLEIFEQAFLANDRGIIGNTQIWSKWKAWMVSWKRTNPYVPYVLSELDDWYTDRFLHFFDNLGR